MADPGSGSFGESPSLGSEPSLGTELGKIGGKLLSNNLQRDGVDLSFRNGFSDADLLYLDVTNSRIGVNTDSPAYDLDINSQIISTNIEVLTQFNVDNIIIDLAGTITTQVGPLNISPAGDDPVISVQGMQSDDLYFNDNVVSSFDNANIRFEPSGSGKVSMYSTAVIHGNLHVKSVGNDSLRIDGDLSSAGTITVGDSPLDTVVIVPDLTQDIVPGDDLQYNLGEVGKRWAEVHVPDWTNIDNLIPTNAFVSDQTLINGATGEISTTQSNDSLILSPDTGILYVEELQFDNVDGTLRYTIDNPNGSGTSAGDWFGYSMAANENYLIVGALNERNSYTGGNDGAAYIFDINDGSLIRTVNPGSYGSSTLWSDVETFGTSVGITDEYFIVGDQNVFGTTGSFGGRAWIFRTSNGSLLHTLFLPTGGSTKWFGRGVAISDSYAIVGAPGDDTTSSDAGQAWIYSTATGTILHQLAPTRTRGEFGHAVAISETYAVVGAPLSDAPNYRSGTVYIFSSSTGVLLHTIDNPNPFGTSDNDRFGWSVAISGDRVIVGAFTDSEAAGASSGRAYIFDASTGALIHRLDNPNAFDTVTGDGFGRSVAISGDRCIVGAWQEDDAGGTASGKAYIFDIINGSLVSTLDNPNAYGTSASDLFGHAVAISSNRAVVGAYLEDDAGGNDSGKAYGYNLRGARITNLNASTPVQFAGTGAGYLRFMGTNAVVIPAGDNSTRPGSPELGDTRWNTDEQYLECFDGSVYVIATGGGEEVTEEFMEELGNVYTLILG